MNSDPPPPPNPAPATPPIPGQPLPSPTAPAPDAGQPPQWGAPSAGSSGGSRTPLFVGLGVLVVVVLLAALLVLGGGDDKAPSAAGNSGPSVADLRQVNAGTFAAGDPIPVTLEEGDVSFLVTAVGDDAALTPVITRVADPDGAVIHEVSEDDGSVSGDLTNTRRESINNTLDVSIIVPVSPALDVRPGTYEVTVDQFDDAGFPAGGNLEVTVLIKSGDVGAETPQYIDVNLWVLSSDFETATLETEVRARMDTVLSSQNLSVGSVKTTPASQDDIAEFAVLDADTQVADACQAMTAAVGEDRSLDLAVVESFVGGETLGFSSGLPGSAPAEGVSASCTLVATQSVIGLAPIQSLASTIVHEASHFLGLTHTSESDNSAFDDFADTPDCDIATFDGRDNLGYPGTPDGLIDAPECGLEGGADNYMFFEDAPEDTRGTLSQTVMSADQAWAIRRHPLVYTAP